MTTFARLGVAAEDMALAETTERLTDASFSVERSAMQATDHTLTLWLTCTTPSAIEAALAADPSIDGWQLIREEENGRLYRLGYAEQFDLVRETIHRYEGTVREAYGGNDGWTFEVRFPSREGLSELADEFDRLDVDVTFESVETITGPVKSGGSVLSESHREVLEVAVERGYYEVPREVTLSELAEEFDVSHQALSERLRRAQANIVGSQISKPRLPSRKVLSD